MRFGMVLASCWDTIERAVKARIVRRMPKAQRGHARDPWQKKTAETAEGELLGMACIVSVQTNGTVTESGVAASSDALSRLHGKECRDRIRVALMCDSTGQQRDCVRRRSDSRQQCRPQELR